MNIVNSGCGHPVGSNTRYSVDAWTGHAFGELVAIPGRGSQELLNVLCRRVVVPYPPVNVIPNVLYWIQIRTASWPVHAGDTSLLQEVPHDACAKWPGVVVLQNTLGSNLLQERNSKGTQDFVPVPCHVQIALYMVQGGGVLW